MNKAKTVAIFSLLISSLITGLFLLPMLFTKPGDRGFVLGSLLFVARIVLLIGGILILVFRIFMFKSIPPIPVIYLSIGFLNLIFSIAITFLFLHRQVALAWFHTSMFNAVIAVLILGDFLLSSEKGY